MAGFPLVLHYGWAATGIYKPYRFPLKTPNATRKVSKFSPIHTVLQGSFPLFLSHKITGTCLGACLVVLIKHTQHETLSLKKKDFLLWGGKTAL